MSESSVTDHNNVPRAVARTAALVLSIALLCPAVSAFAAADCPGHPGALGTSRTLVVDPTEHRRVGVMQYPETVPLQDHEVVLTFDDGPLPAHTNAVLDTLAAQCVKATFFMVGKMAKEFPETARRVHDEGHTIGTHSNSHPFSFGAMPIEHIKAEIDDGIANVSAAFGDTPTVAPFFRIPGLQRSEVVESYLASRDIMVWSADFLADDWRHISSARVIQLALQRLEARGRGILLLHDIQERTQIALPVILRELKARGYRVVHVVPASTDQPKTATDPQAWMNHLPRDQNPMVRMSVRSIWLARAPRPSSAAEVVLQKPTPENFRIDDVKKQFSKDESRPASQTRMPGSWPITAGGMTFGPLSPPVANADPLKPDSQFLR